LWAIAPYSKSVVSHKGMGAEHSHEAYGSNHYSNNDKDCKSKFVDETCDEDDKIDDTRPYYEGSYIVVAVAIVRQPLVMERMRQ